MATHKRQHFLPTAYLKYFSSDQNACARDSWIWRLDGEAQRHVPIISQCFEKYHYSKKDPVQTEKMFQEGEAAYCECLDLIRAGKTLSGTKCGTLLVLMFDLFIRNAIHKNRTEEEGIGAYRIRSRSFLQEILLGQKGKEVTQ